jgi:hypothetical protein
MYWITFLSDDILSFIILLEEFVTPFLKKLNIYFVNKDFVVKLDSTSLITTVADKMFNHQSMELLDFALVATLEQRACEKEDISFKFSSIVDLEHLLHKNLHQVEWLFITCGSHYFKEIIFLTRHDFVNKLLEVKIEENKLQGERQEKMVTILDSLDSQQNRHNTISKDIKSDIHMSSYLVEHSLCKTISAVIFEKLDPPFQRLMKSCNLKIDDILLISDMIPYGQSEVISNQSLIFPIEVYSYFLSEAISNGVESRKNTQYKELFVMQFNDVEQLKEICDFLSISQADTMLIIPKETDIQLFKTLLTKAYQSGADLLSGDEWMCLSEIKQTTKWFYGIERVYLHDYCSIFISKSSELLDKFNELNIDDEYKFIGCF